MFLSDKYPYGILFAAITCLGEPTHLNELLNSSIILSIVHEFINMVEDGTEMRNGLTVKVLKDLRCQLSIMVDSWNSDLWFENHILTTPNVLLFNVAKQLK